MLQIAKIITLILHPVFFPLYIICLTSFYIPEINANNSFFVFCFSVFLWTIFLPLITIGILFKRKLIPSLEMNSKKERVLPLLITLFFIVFGYLINQNVLADIHMLKAIFLATIISLFTSTIISLFWKISLHMIGIGGCVGVLLGIHLLYINIIGVLITFFFISILLGLVRLKLNAHNIYEVFGGFLLGFLTSFICALI